MNSCQVSRYVQVYSTLCVISYTFDKLIHCFEDPRTKPSWKCWHAHKNKVEVHARNKIF